jgi:hypothetical protein
MGHLKTGAHQKKEICFSRPRPSSLEHSLAHDSRRSRGVRRVNRVGQQLNEFNFRNYLKVNAKHFFHCFSYPKRSSAPRLPDFSWYKIPKRGKKYQMTTKYTKWPHNISNSSKIDQVVIEYPKIFRCKTLQNLPKFGIFGLKTNRLATLLCTTMLFLRHSRSDTKAQTDKSQTHRK